MPTVDRLDEQTLTEADKEVLSGVSDDLLYTVNNPQKVLEWLGVSGW